MEYRIIEQWTGLDLERVVTDWLKDGWRPAGGVAVAASDGGNIRMYVQAICRPLPAAPPTAGETRTT